ncbi:hypothetical protein O181_037012 [Austropuccinia psidii MF-1]|uniref:DH domain-containing protein n=1 Tax=Austropuccinia psidii MF-1 TaxID=1389203 RepID=A0A9Q3DBU1_9BASI|nr:hypothetical protein [Austropuccinia psidii MF-1]
MKTSNPLNSDPKSNSNEKIFLINKNFKNLKSLNLKRQTWSPSTTSPTTTTSPTASPTSIHNKTLTNLFKSSSKSSPSSPSKLTTKSKAYKILYQFKTKRSHSLDSQNWSQSNPNQNISSNLNSNSNSNQNSKLDSSNKSTLVIQSNSKHPNLINQLFEIDDDKIFIETLEKLKIQFNLSNALNQNLLPARPKSLSNPIDSNENWNKHLHNLLIIKEFISSEKSYLKNLINLLDAFQHSSHISNSQTSLTLINSFHQSSSFILPSPTIQLVLGHHHHHPQINSFNALDQPNQFFNPPIYYTISGGLDSSFGPKACLLKYLPNLILISKKLINLLEINPTSIGLAKSFLIVHHEMKIAYRSWCLVSEIIRKELGNKILITNHKSNQQIQSNSSHSKTNHVYGLWRSLSNRESSKDFNSNSKRFLISDVVIMPIQRITRYQLFFIQLLQLAKSISHLHSLKSSKSNPNLLIRQRALSESNCDSRIVILQRALDKSKSIAEHCNRLP